MSTMSCAQARERLLEAELEELTGRVETELAGHLRGCDRCRALADAVVAEERALDRALAAAAAADAEPAVRRARLAVLPGDVARRNLPRWAGYAAALAAALLAGLLLLRAPDLLRERTAPQTRPTVALVTEVRARALVNVPRDQRVAVFRQPERRVTIVWYF